MVALGYRQLLYQYFESGISAVSCGICDRIKLRSTKLALWLRMRHWLLVGVVGVHHELTQSSEFCAPRAARPPSSCGAYVDVVLVVDASVSIATAHANVSEAMQRYVDGFVLEGTAGGRVGIVEFRGCSACSVAASANVLSPLSTDRTALSDRINGRGPSENSTCISCGLEVAQELLQRTNRSGAAAVIILISDGGLCRV